MSALEKGLVHKDDAASGLRREGPIASRSADMVERVARVLFIEDCEHNPDTINDPTLGIDSPKYGWQLFIPDARAAILAMREPSHEMQHAGASVRIQGNHNITTLFHTEAEQVWQAMIAEALNDG